MLLPGLWAGLLSCYRVLSVHLTVLYITWASDHLPCKINSKVEWASGVSGTSDSAFSHRAHTEEVSRSSFLGRFKCPASTSSQTPGRTRLIINQIPVGSVQWTASYSKTAGEEAKEGMMLNTLRPHCCAVTQEPSPLCALEQALGGVHCMGMGIGYTFGTGGGQRLTNDVLRLVFLCRIPATSPHQVMESTGLQAALKKCRQEKIISRAKCMCVRLRATSGSPRAAL